MHGICNHVISRTSETEHTHALASAISSVNDDDDDEEEDEEDEEDDAAAAAAAGAASEEEEAAAAAAAPSCALEEATASGTAEVAEEYEVKPSPMERSFVNEGTLFDASLSSAP